MSDPRPDLHLHFHGDLGTQQDALRGWAEHVLFTAGVTLRVGEIRDRLRSGADLPYPIDVEVIELASVLRHGVQLGAFTSTDGERFGLSELRLELLGQVSAESAAMEAAVRSDWLAEIHAEYPELPREVDDELWDGLVQFICDTVRRFRDRVAKAGTGPNGLDQGVFPEGSPLYEVADTAFPAFLMSPDPQRRALFRRFLSHALFAFTTSVSKEAASALRDSLAGRGLWLDTNVLLPALGLTGDPEFEAAIRRVLAIARQLKLKLLVTSRTIEEFNAMFERFARRATNDSAPEYVRRRVSPSIDRAYFVSRSEDYLTPDEFIHRYRDVTRQLVLDKHNLGVQIDDIPELQSNDIEASQFFATALDALRSVERRSYHQSPLEHDAFHLAYMNSLRRRDTWAEASGWFLTLDRSLRRAESRLPASTPLSMSVDEWVITFRQFAPRVDDFEDFVSAILTRTLFPSFYLNQADVVLFARLAAAEVSRDAHEVLSRILRTAPSSAITESLGGHEEIEQLIAGIEELAQQDSARRQALANYGKARLEARIAEEKQRAKSATEEAQETQTALKKVRNAMARLLALDEEDRNAFGDEARLDGQAALLETRRAAINASVAHSGFVSVIIVALSVVVVVLLSATARELLLQVAPLLSVLGLILGGGGVSAAVRSAAKARHAVELREIEVQLNLIQESRADLQRERDTRASEREAHRKELAD